MGTTISTIRSNSNPNNLNKTLFLLSQKTNYCTAATRSNLNSNSNSISNGSNRLLQTIILVRDPGVSIVPVLDQWITEGNNIKPSDLQRLIRALRTRKRYSHALQLSEWGSTNNFCRDSSVSHAVQLDLIGAVRGIDAAESYFSNLTDTEKDERTYGALLSRYTREGLVDKSLSLMQTMKEIGFASRPLAYINLMYLYSNTDQSEKILDVLSEMKKSGIPPDNSSYRICINSCGERSDFNNMEKLLEDMERQPNITMDWTTYNTAISHYIKGNQKEKALVVLKKMEKINKEANGYSHLISHYAKLGHKDEVMRLWGIQKLRKKQDNTDYIMMLGTLVTLGELQESEKVLKEWESSCYIFDFRVPNALYMGLCSKGLTEKAETMLKNMIDTGKTPIPNSWVIICCGYVDMENMEKASKCMKEALAVAENSSGWKPHPKLISSILHWLGEKGEIADVEAFVTSLRSVIPVNKEMYHALIKANKRVGKGVDEIIKRMKYDKLEPDEETQRILSSEADETE
ncbi:pentatricopeptide repeat-containing protein, mitochondrial-like [Heracleum sosnowskyi]|uniref:Pentatricopeptide repeat-containing protein, mitochondrial-like n=1 Tax=Heracleum sosnowskyi TaxID=360622 RepID=A0AAD8N3T1_9APIA|nr:pentatricopeptide repeat-containing protein, mitochondrial-like [Heracleum sosnowskyi]